MQENSVFDSPSGERNRFLEAAVCRAQLAMIASDVTAKDEPIIFANEAFENLTGYTQDEILGRSCSFLQGEGTSAQTIAAIRAAISNGKEGYFEILNYRKNGTSFWNGLHIGPASDPGSNPAIFFGSQRDISLEVETRQLETVRMEDLRHRMGNLMAIVGIIIKNSDEGSDVKSMREILQGRIAALGAATEMIYPKVDTSKDVTRQSLEPRTVEIEKIIRTIIEPLGCPQKFDISGPLTALSDQQTTNISLVIHELSTNAAKYGALIHADGRVSIRWTIAAGRILVDWIETGGKVITQPDRKGLGRRLLDSIVSSSSRRDAALLFEPSGVTCKFDVVSGSGQ